MSGKFYTEQQAVKMALVRAQQHPARKGASQNEQAVRQIQSTVSQVLKAMREGTSAKSVKFLLQQLMDKAPKIINQLDATYYTKTGHRIAGQLIDTLNGIWIPTGIDMPNFFGSASAQDVEAVVERAGMYAGLLLDPKVQSNPVANLDKLVAAVNSIAEEVMDFSGITKNGRIVTELLEGKLRDLRFELNHIVGMTARMELPQIEPELKSAIQAIDDAKNVVKGNQGTSTQPVGIIKTLMRPIYQQIFNLAEKIGVFGRSHYGARSYRPGRIKATANQFALTRIKDATQRLIVGLRRGGINPREITDVANLALANLAGIDPGTYDTAGHLALDEMKRKYQVLKNMADECWQLYQESPDSPELKQEYQKIMSGLDDIVIPELNKLIKAKQIDPTADTAAVLDPLLDIQKLLKDIAQTIDPKNMAMATRRERVMRLLGALNDNFRLTLFKFPRGRFAQGFREKFEAASAKIGYTYADLRDDMVPDAISNIQEAVHLMDVAVTNLKQLAG